MYRSTELEPYVWFKWDLNLLGDEYYKYTLVYVDDILHLEHDPKEDVDYFNRTYRFK